MRVLGLDPSLSNYGWALHDTQASGSDRVVECGRFRTKRKDYAYEIDRYTYLRDALKDLILRLNPDRMGIEHPVFGDSYSEGMYGLYLFSLDAIKTCDQDVVLFLPPQVKKFANDILQRPKGWKMQKVDMVEAAKEDTGGKGRWDHNEADAYHVARAAGRFWLLYEGQIDEDSLSSYEAQAFTFVKTWVRGRRAGQTKKQGIIHRENEKFFLWSKENEDGKEG